ncbi:MAG: DUF1905 domain-containing protein [Lewinellaceae bacterium]|nr:DUF1905 domain-containing protein [Lewinellaceae bacterium]
MAEKYSFRAKVEVFHGRLWSYHVIIPKDIFEKLDDAGTDRRVMVSINDHQFQSAMMPAGDGQYFIMFNKEKRSILKINEGDDILLNIWHDESKYGMEMPPEFLELMHQDPELDRYFHDLTPGKQRNLLYIIGKVKNPDIKLHKALVIAQHLKMREGALDFRQLNEDFKNNKYGSF